MSDKSDHAEHDLAPLIVGRTYKVNEEGDLETTPDPTPVLASIRRSFRFLVAATVAVYLALGGVAFFSYSGTAAVRSGVCNLRTDLERRVATSEDFIEKHPQKLKEFGLTKAQIQKEIENQRRTLRALDVVSC